LLWLFWRLGGRESHFMNYLPILASSVPDLFFEVLFFFGGTGI
jgi:hypothetical protein